MYYCYVFSRLYRMADQFDLLLTACGELDEDLSNIDRGDNQRHDRIGKHLKLVDTEIHYKVPDFKKGEWLNCKIYSFFVLPHIKLLLNLSHKHDQKIKKTFGSFVFIKPTFAVVPTNKIRGGAYHKKSQLISYEQHIYETVCHMINVS